MVLQVAVIVAAGSIGVLLFKVRRRKKMYQEDVRHDYKCKD